jgi:hypothetical protein
LLDPLLHVGSVEATELRVAKERQHVAIESLSVTHARRRSMTGPRLPPRLRKLADRLAARLAVNE